MSTATQKDPRDVILSPVVSEKSYSLIDQGKYTFIVDPRSNKTEIKLAIEKIFSVEVASINTLNKKGIPSGISCPVRSPQVDSRE